MKPLFSIIIPSYNPDEDIFLRVLDALYAQSIPPSRWELIIVNNASTQWPSQDFFKKHTRNNARVLVEHQQGATYARKCGLEAARADLAILVDDDNILEGNYLETAIDLISQYPKIGAFGGRLELEFISPPPSWIDRCRGILASWDHGDSVLISNGIRPHGSTQNYYPPFSPLTAGLVLRRPTWEAWLAHLRTQPIMQDRCGDSLSSGGDNDAILAILKSGWEVGYFPTLKLTNIIPEFRLNPTYLAKLNYECQLGLMIALRRHDACPWPAIPYWTLPLRLILSFFRYRAWRSRPDYILWRGQVGRYCGLLKSAKLP